MIQTREITYPITLTTAQLSYLLALIEASTLIGGDDEALFPRVEAVREGQWQQGREELEADGWLVHDNGTGTYRLNEQLMLIIAVLADPEVVSLTKWQTAGRQERGVGHYFGTDMVIEMASDRGVYQLVVLPDVPTMVRRVENAIGFPEIDRERISFELSRESVEQAKRNPDPDWLASRGLSRQEADAFSATLRRPAIYGTVTVLRALLGRAVTMRLVGILISADQQAWVATPVDSRRVRYASVDGAAFESTLAEIVDELYNVPVA